MKRFFCLLFALVLLPVFSFASSAYQPELGMDISTFMSKYNSLGSSLSSSLTALEKPYQWTSFEKYRVAWFNPDKKSSVKILLLSADPKAGLSLDSGVDIIQIYMENPADFLSFVTIAIRCSQLFSTEFFGSSLAPLCVGDILSYFYENSSTSYSAYRSLDSDNVYALMFFIDQNSYYFQISLRSNI